LIEAMAVLFIFSLIAVTFYSVFTIGTKHIIESKNKLAAISLATEKMEIVRSLGYGQIGIKDNGYIEGDILETEDLILDGRNFFVFSSVTYVDDSRDGTEDGSPDDYNPADYKRVTIKVAWENDIDTRRAVSLVSDFAPPGVEEIVGGGTLVVKVLNRSSVGISQMTVHIKNSGLGIDENFLTDSGGGISLPGIPADDNDYEISVSKSGYFPIETFPAYPVSNFSPAYVHASVTEGNKNIYSITTDQSSNLSLKTEDCFGNSISNLSFNLKGGMKKGDTINLPDNPSVPIYYYDQNLNSGTNGRNEIADLSYGNYIFSFTDTESSYEFVKVSPFNELLNDRTKFAMESGSSSEIKAVFADKNINSLLVTVQDKTTSAPIKNASVKLQNLSLPSPYDVTLTTDEYGLAYFPNNLPELVAESYSLTIEAEGYASATDNATVNKYTKKEINLELN